jgi:hypothetical protein
MKIEKKYQSRIPSLSEYTNLCKKLWEIATLQQKLLPHGLGYGVEICNGMINFEHELIPVCGFMIGDYHDVDGVCEAMADELRSVVSEHGGFRN